jgi:flagellar protein FlaG
VEIMRIPSLSGPSPAGQANAEPQAVAARPAIQTPQSAAPAVEAPTPAQLSEVVARTRNAVREVASNLEFSVDGDTGKTVVRVVDASTQELIRQIPSEEMLSIARNMDRIEGLLIKSKA